jgi:hypothetical protein
MLRVQSSATALVVSKEGDRERQVRATVRLRLAETHLVIGWFAAFHVSIKGTGIDQLQYLRGRKRRTRTKPVIEQFTVNASSMLISSPK